MLKNIENLSEIIAKIYIVVSLVVMVVLVTMVIGEHSNAKWVLGIAVPIVGATVGAVAAAFYGAKKAGDISQDHQNEKFQLDRTTVQVDAANNIILQIEKARVQLLSFASDIAINQNFILNQIKKMPSDQRFGEIDFKIESLIYIVPRQDEFSYMKNNNEYWWYSPLNISSTVDFYNMTIDRWDTLLKEIRKNGGLQDLMAGKNMSGDEDQRKFIELCHATNTENNVADIVYRYQQLLIFTEHLLLLFGDFTSKFPNIVRLKTDDVLRKKHDLIILHYSKFVNLPKFPALRFNEIDYILGANGHDFIRKIRSNYEPYLTFIAAQPKTPAPDG
jgi:hypothetical protein